MSKVLTNLLGQFRKMLATPASGQDPLFLNNIFFRAGELEIELNRTKRTLEANRKPKQFEIRDQLMEEKGMSRTAAEAEARTSEEYLAYVAQIDEATEAAEVAGLLKDAAKQRAWLAKDEREWARKQTQAPEEAEGE